MGGDFHNVIAWGQEEQHLASIQRKFLQYLPPGGRVLDLGCGRGVFLQLLREGGFEPVGVDLDEQMARASREKGFDVVVDDAIHFLSETEQSYDAILASHVIEHMPVAEQVRFIELMKARLDPGGVAIVVTPRPGSLWATENFWLDTTHVRPVAYDLMRSLFEPFEVLAGGVEPDSYALKDHSAPARAIAWVRRKLIGPELFDFAYGGGASYIVARRPRA